MVAAAAQSTVDQVHQQEGEVVEHVAGGDPVVELDGVEQHRLAVDQHDVAEMQIAVAAPHQALARSRSISSGRQGGERVARGVGERSDLRGSKQRRARRAVRRRSARRSRPARRRSRNPSPTRRLVMRLRHRASERVGQRGVDLAAPRPDDRASAFRRSGPSPPPIRPAARRRRWRGVPSRCARDRHHAAIDRRRIRPVDRDLGLAGGFAFVQASNNRETETSPRA